MPMNDASHPSIHGFWAYVHERWQIELRRKAGLLAPWTDSDVLRTFHFCCVLRENDRGTLWYTRHVVPTFRSPADGVWKTIILRRINSPAAFSYIQEITKEDPIFSLNYYREHPDVVAEAFSNLPKVSSPAYLITGGLKRGETFRTKLLEELAQFAPHMDEYSAALKKAPSLQEGIKVLCTLPRVGGFIAFQIARDLVLAGSTDWDEDDWTYVGPGARPMLYMLFGDVNNKLEQTALRRIQKARATSLEEIGLEDNLPYLNLSEIEHNCCEYRKFVNRLNATGRRRYFVAHMEAV